MRPQTEVQPFAVSSGLGYFGYDVVIMYGQRYIRNTYRGDNRPTKGNNAASRATRSAPQPGAARVEAVLRATGRWQQELVDTSGRNFRLRRYRDLKTGTLDLTPGQSDTALTRLALDRLLAGKPIDLSDLFPEATQMTSQRFATPADASARHTQDGPQQTLRRRE